MPVRSFLFYEYNYFLIFTLQDRKGHDLIVKPYNGSLRATEMFVTLT